MGSRVMCVGSGFGGFGVYVIVVKFGSGGCRIQGHVCS